MALDRILAIDPRGLHDTVRKRRHHDVRRGTGGEHAHRGASPGATRAELVRYATSGDINGDRDEVVGYAGVIVT